jgi:hypothetical protein
MARLSRSSHELSIAPVLVAGQIAARACGIDQTAVGALWFGLARYDRSGWLGMTA